MTVSSYQAALNDIYATFMRVKHLNKGRFDRDARQPQRLLAIANERMIVPPQARVIKVAGSKGKGTTARIAIRILQTDLPDKKIGLFVSPEEDDHFDRMRINGVAMTPDQFVRHYSRLKPRLLNAEADLQGPDYLSPLGIFLLIALDWFDAEHVDYCVLETGRGVAHDEVGQIQSAVGILTSIMLEHADKLGPALADIARDKLSLCQTSTIVVAPPQVAATAQQMVNLEAIVPESFARNDLPHWLNLNNDLARAGVRHLLGRATPSVPLTDWRDVSASFGIHTINSHVFVFEGLIHTDSLDEAMLDHWRHGNLPTTVVASFPDDKDRTQLLAAFKARGWPITECILTGTRGYLDYMHTAADNAPTCVTFAYDNVAGFAAWLGARAASQEPGRTYLVGTQTYLRLVRKALVQMNRSGGQHA
jgi:hypothetical protein